jgi:hypothetical protein
MFTYVSSNRTFLIAILVLLGTLIVDVSLSNVWDLVPDHGWGIDIFVLMLIVFGSAQYFIFNHVRIRSKILMKKNKSVSSLFILAIIAQSLASAFFLTIALQILAISQYETLLLTISSDINFGSAAILLFLLSLLFFKWYKRTKKFVMLLYGVSVLVTGVSILIVAIASTEILSNQPAWRGVTAAFPDFLNQNTTIQTIQSVNGTYSLVSVLLIWTSTALLINHYSKKIGKLKFWAIMSIPLILAINQYVVVSPIIGNNLSSLEGSSLMYGILLGTTLQDSKLLGDIAQAQMESVLETKVISTIRIISQEILEDEGISLSLNDDDARQYLHDVLEEKEKLTERRGPGPEAADGT